MTNATFYHLASSHLWHGLGLSVMVVNGEKIHTDHEKENFYQRLLLDC